MGHVERFAPSVRTLKNATRGGIPLLLALVGIAAFCPSRASAAEAARPDVKTQANVRCEITFESAAAHADPFNEVTLDVVFTSPSGARYRVPAFWDGGKVWKVRYASGAAGEHRFRSECSDAHDAGLHGVEGVVRLEPYRGDNPLLLHGPLRVAADKRHLEHADGTPFLWLGDTWWMGLSNRLHFPDEFQALAADRKEKGFNVIQIVAGLYPDQPAFDERSANEAGFAWEKGEKGEKDYARIRPEYFDAADRRIEYLVDQGFVPCIVAAWGYHLPWLGEEKMKQHLRYLSARYGAMPVVWCAAGEFNLPFYLTPGFPRGGEKQAGQWAGEIDYLRSVNPFGRPVTAHPTGIEPLSARAVLKQLGKDPALLDFDMLQTGHGQREVLAPTVSTLRASYAAEPPMPVIDAEVAYEALSGKIPAEVPRLMCWTCLLSGAAGHTYGANGIWQLNRKDQPYGNSPWGGNYGPIPWDEAMRLPGSAQVGYDKKLLEKLPFEKFEPHPEWAVLAPSDQAPPGKGATDKGQADKFLVPYAGGVPKVVRVIYVPTPDPIVVRGLEAGVRYAASRFDPATGKATDAGVAEPDASGSWPVAVPQAAQGGRHDWVLVLDARRGDAGKNATAPGGPP